MTRSDNSRPQTTEPTELSAEELDGVAAGDSKHANWINVISVSSPSQSSFSFGVEREMKESGEKG